MQLYIDSDAAYLVAPKANSQIAGYFHLSDTYKPGSDISSLKLNELIHIGCQLLKHVVSSVVEVGISGIFLNCKTAIWIKRMLEALGHKQRIIPIKTYNSTTEVFSNLSLRE